MTTVGETNFLARQEPQLRLPTVLLRLNIQLLKGPMFVLRNVGSNQNVCPVGTHIHRVGQLTFLGDSKVAVDNHMSLVTGRLLVILIRRTSLGQVLLGYIQILPRHLPGMIPLGQLHILPGNNIQLHLIGLWTPRLVSRSGYSIP